MINQALQDVQFSAKVHNFASMLSDLFSMSLKENESLETFGIRLDHCIYRGLGADIREEYVVQLYLQKARNPKLRETV